MNGYIYMLLGLQISNILTLHHHCSYIVTFTAICVLLPLLCTYVFLQLLLIFCNLSVLLEVLNILFIIIILHFF